jgi:hypothetical protein
MYLLTKSRSLRLAAHETPSAICALFVAETFYRFHSFTLECLAFLATWFAFSWLLNKAWHFYRRDVLPHVRLSDRIGAKREKVGLAAASPSDMGGTRG